ncbi:MAG: hypothetical protein JOZ25_12420 [Actinobacteria bacterium]|nr:hypothetical protein [Actinomycetota bacterium]
MAIAIMILVLLVVGGFIGAALNFGSGILGIPLVLIFVGALLGKETMQRQQRILQMKRFRRQARARKVEFDAADKRTVV